MNKGEETAKENPSWYGMPQGCETNMPDLSNLSRKSEDRKKFQFPDYEITIFLIFSMKIYRGLSARLL